jgi:hypothetical protein
MATGRWLKMAPLTGKCISENGGAHFHYIFRDNKHFHEFARNLINRFGKDSYSFYVCNPANPKKFLCRVILVEQILPPNTKVFSWEYLFPKHDVIGAM